MQQEIIPFAWGKYISERNIMPPGLWFSSSSSYQTQRVAQTERVKHSLLTSFSWSFLQYVCVATKLWFSKTSLLKFWKDYFSGYIKKNLRPLASEANANSCIHHPGLHILSFSLNVTLLPALALTVATEHKSLMLSSWIICRWQDWTNM